MNLEQIQEMEARLLSAASYEENPLHKEECGELLALSKFALTANDALRRFQIALGLQRYEIRDVLKGIKEFNPEDEDSIDSLEGILERLRILGAEMAREFSAFPADRGNEPIGNHRPSCHIAGCMGQCWGKP